jgi:hypothetical protein
MQWHSSGSEKFLHLPKKFFVLQHVAPFFSILRSARERRGPVRSAKRL